MSIERDISLLFCGVEKKQSLEIMNNLLDKLQLKMEKQAPSRRWPIIFVLGPMRSGTTLTHQILTSQKIFSGITNFVARFWQAPAVGALIEQAVLEVSGNATEFLSEFGRTQGLSGYHEFGFFWNRWFDFGHDTHHLPEHLLNRVDLKGLLSSLASLEGIYKKPIVFHNPSWFNFQADWLSRNIPNSVFVVCQRDPLYVAQSVMIARRKNLGDDGKWWSIKPSNFSVLKSLSPWEQVVAQVRYVEYEMQQAISKVSKHQIVTAKYQDVCADPVGILNRVIDVSNSLGTTIEHLERNAIQPFKSKDQVQLNSHDWGKLVESFERFKF